MYETEDGITFPSEEAAIEHQNITESVKQAQNLLFPLNLDKFDFMHSPDYIQITPSTKAKFDNLFAKLVKESANHYMVQELIKINWCIKDSKLYSRFYFARHSDELDGKCIAEV